VQEGSRRKEKRRKGKKEKRRKKGKIMKIFVNLKIFKK
jgi:hypothetical protein